jgi:hypothetical protein
MGIAKRHRKYLSTKRELRNIKILSAAMQQMSATATSCASSIIGISESIGRLIVLFDLIDKLKTGKLQRCEL